MNGRSHSGRATLLTNRGSASQPLAPSRYSSASFNRPLHPCDRQAYPTGLESDISVVPTLARLLKNETGAHRCFRCWSFCDRAWHRIVEFVHPSEVPSFSILPCSFREEISREVKTRKLKHEKFYVFHSSASLSAGRGNAAVGWLIRRFQV